MADRLLEAAARVLAQEGQDAVTARRLATEIDASTMAVYTHFGSMDELLLQLWRLGFARFGEALNGPPFTDDPVADWFAQGWAYRRFALQNRHLYRVLFGGVVPVKFDDPADQDAATATFTSLLTRLQRAADAGRLVLPDLELAGHVTWSVSHGQVTIELDGYYAAMRRDPAVVFSECLRRLALAFGDDADAIERSLERSRGVLSRR